MTTLILDGEGDVLLPENPQLREAYAEMLRLRIQYELAAIAIKDFLKARETPEEIQF